MKKYILLSVSVLLAAVGNAQVWQGTGSANLTGGIYRSGNVGIGNFSADPTSNLHLRGQNLKLTLDGVPVTTPTTASTSTLELRGTNATINFIANPVNQNVANLGINFGATGSIQYNTFPACGTGSLIFKNSAQQIVLKTDGVNFGGITGCGPPVFGKYTFDGSIGTTQLYINAAYTGGTFLSGYSFANYGKAYFSAYTSIGSTTDISANGYVFNVTGNSNFSGNVGIGTTNTPQARLHVNGDVLIENEYSSILFGNASRSGLDPNWRFGGIKGDDGQNKKLFVYHSASIRLANETPGNGNYSSGLYLVGNNVGIGLAVPQARLHVNGNIINGGFDFILGLNDGRPNAANVQPANMRALSHTNWKTAEKNELIINSVGDFTGGTIVEGNKMYVTGNLGIGIGTSESPKERLHVNGNVLVSGEIKSNFVISSFRTPDAGNFAGSINIGALDPANTSPSTWMMANVATLNKTMDKVVFARWSPTTWTNAMSIHKDGQVVVGSGDLPSAASCLKLYVDGTAGAKEVRVSQATWCDYVFDESYQLKPLEEVEAFIKANKHLPEIPSEKEVVDNGMGLGEMSKMHMKKIEELTLYMIELKKQNDKLSERNDKLSDELAELKALILNK